MIVTIQSIHFDADVRLKDFIQSKLSKLRQYHDGIVDAQVYLKLDKNHEVGNKVVEVKMLVPSNTIVSTQQARTFEEATDLCVDQLKRQLVKTKEKDKDKHKAIPSTIGIDGADVGIGDGFEDF
jgi:putative sigma-54 modulation protein